MSEAEPKGWECPAFAVDGRIFTVRDVIESARFRGELEHFLAGAHASGPEPDEAALQSASEQFRYERDLITAEETERWLEARGLTLEDFSDYLRRSFWKAANGKNIPAETSGGSDLLRVELLLSGEFDRLAVRLAWRIVAAGGEWAGRLGRDETLQLEAAYRQQCAALLTREARERMLHALRLPLTRVELETVELESHDAAREAFLCVQEDGIGMADVAKDGRYPYRRDEIACEDLPEESQQKILCAAPGEVLEPIARGDGFQLCRLVRKIAPDLADARTRERVEQRILESHFSELAASCVQWMLAPSAAYDRGSR